MIDITLQLDEPTHLRLRRTAAEAGMTPAQWVTDLIIRHSGPEPAGKAVAQWPDSVLRLDGAWADFPSIEALRSGMVSDVAREPF